MKMKIIGFIVPAMIAAFAFNASAATISPQESVHMDSEDFGTGTYRIGFGIDNISDKDIIADIYDKVFYDIEDIENLSKGDIIETANDAVEVNTIEHSGRMFTINGGFFEDGITLFNPEDTTECVQIEYEMPAYLFKGQAQLTFADKVSVSVFKTKEDGRPTEGFDTVECDAAQVQEELKKAAKTLSDEFWPNQAEVTLEDDLLTEITIHYVP